MIKEKKTIKEITENYRYCDDCGAEIPRGLMCSVVKCEICKKDLCNNCIGNEGEDFWIITLEDPDRLAHLKYYWKDIYKFKIILEK